MIDGPHMLITYVEPLSQDQTEGCVFRRTQNGDIRVGCYFEGCKTACRQEGKGDEPGRMQHVSHHYGMTPALSTYIPYSSYFADGQKRIAPVEKSARPMWIPSL